jgi:hypothetical protein
MLTNYVESIQYLPKNEDYNDDDDNNNNNTNTMFTLQATRNFLDKTESGE